MTQKGVTPPSPSQAERLGFHHRARGIAQAVTGSLEDLPVLSKAPSAVERNTDEHREPQADVGQQDWETPPHKPGPPAGLREGLARALEAGGPERRPRGPRPTERGGRADAPPGTPAVGARRASAAGSRREKMRLPKILLFSIIERLAAPALQISKIIVDVQTDHFKQWNHLHRIARALFRSIVDKTQTVLRLQHTFTDEMAKNRSRPQAVGALFSF